VTTSLSRDAFQAALDAATADLSPAERVAVAERVATAVARTARRTRYPSPGVLAHKLDPLTTRETPFLRCLDEELVAATRAMEAGQGARLGVFAPPQEGKSRRVTIAFVLWLLVRNPNLRIGIASYEQETAATFSTPIRNWITEHGSGTPLNPRPLTEDLLGITLRGDSTSKTRFDLAGHNGGLLALGMKGGWSGKPLDVLVIDDPYKDRERADSAKHRKAVEEWFQNVAIPRFPTAGPPAAPRSGRWCGAPSTSSTPPHRRAPSSATSTSSGTADRRGGWAPAPAPPSPWTRPRAAPTRRGSSPGTAAPTAACTSPTTGPAP
jgi:hypothetical protein